MLAYLQGEEGLVTERESDRRLANFFEASGAKAQP